MLLHSTSNTYSLTKHLFAKEVNVCPLIEFFIIKRLIFKYMIRFTKLV